MTYLRSSAMKRGRTEVYHNPYEVVSKVTEFVEKASEKVDACVDHTRPSLIDDIQALKQSFIHARERGIKLRFVTEITIDNLNNCKQLVKSYVNELRHLDGIRGNFYVSEMEYVSPAANHEKGKPASHVVYSNVQEVVEQGQYLFETLWNKAVPAEQRIREIEEGVEHHETLVIDNSEEIIRMISRLTADSTELATCLSSGGIHYSHKHFFEIKKKLLEKQKRGEHRGIRYITYVDNQNVELVKLYLEYGIQVKHIQNLPPMSFGVSDKKVAVTIEKIEDGIEPAKIEILMNPEEALKRSRKLVKSAKHEVLRIYPSFNGFRRQISMGALHLFREALERNKSVRILVPADEEQMEHTIKEIQLALPKLDIRGLDKTLQTQIGVIVVDRKESMIIELKDDTKEKYHDAAGLAAYSNSKPIALSYASIFETLWKQGELYERLKAYNMMQKEFINIAAHELRTPVQPILGLSQVLLTKKNGTEHSEEMLHVINRNAERLRQRIEDILDVTKIESQALHLKNERFVLNDLIQNVINEYASQIKRDQRRVSISFFPRDNFIIQGDKVRI